MTTAQQMIQEKKQAAEDCGHTATALSNCNVKQLQHLQQLEDAAVVADAIALEEHLKSQSPTVHLEAPEDDNSCVDK